MRCPILLAILMAFTSFTNLSAQTWVEFGVYDVGSWNGSQWLPPDGRIGQATDIQAIINHLSGGFPTPPNHAGTTNPTFDVTSSFADIYGLQRDNLISPLDILWIVNHMNLKYHQNANLPCDVNGSGAVTPWMHYWLSITSTHVVRSRAHLQRSRPSLPVGWLSNQLGVYIATGFVWNSAIFGCDG